MHTHPALVIKLTHAHNSWIVGSAAEPNKDFENIRDYDVLVPFENWYQAAMLIPLDAFPNTFGGWKCISETKEVDVWPGCLSDFIQHSPVKWAWHPKSGIRIKIEK